MVAERTVLALLAFLLTYAIHGTLLLSLAWLAARRLPRSANRLREGVWKVALLGGFATAALQLGLGLEPGFGGWRLAAAPRAPLGTDAAPGLPAGERGEPLRRDGLQGRAQLAPPPAEVAGASSLPLAPRHGESETGGLRAARTAGGAHPSPFLDSLPASEGGAAGALAPASSGRPSAALGGGWIGLAAGLWGAGGLLALGLFALLWLRVARRLVGRRELAEGPLCAMLRDLERAAGLRRPVRLFVAPRLRAPISVGLLRPAICVPERALRELSPAEQESMLAHELAHVVRRDPAWLTLAWLCERLFFFQPLNRVARRELEEVCEELCDDWAVRHTGRRVELASCLARVAGWIVTEPRAVLCTSMARGAHTRRGRSRLGRRIERLLVEGRAQDEPRRVWLAPVSAALLAALAALAPGVSAAEPARAGGATPGAAGGASGIAGFAVPATAAPLAPPGRGPAPSTAPAPVPAVPPGPAPAPGRTTAPGPRAPLADDLAALDEAVAGLERELRALREEFREHVAEPEIAAALAALERRTESLRGMRRRLGGLALLVLPQGPTEPDPIRPAPGERDPSVR